MENANYIRSLMNAGASGYLSKNRDNYDLINQIIEGKVSKNIFSQGLKIENIIKPTIPTNKESINI